MATKVFSIKNKSNSTLNIAADSKEEALEIALKVKHIRKAANALVQTGLLDLITIPKAKTNLQKALNQNKKGIIYRQVPSQEWVFV